MNMYCCVEASGRQFFLVSLYVYSLDCAFLRDFLCCMPFFNAKIFFAGCSKESTTGMGIMMAFAFYSLLYLLWSFLFSKAFANIFCAFGLSNVYENQVLV